MNELTEPSPEFDQLLQQISFQRLDEIARLIELHPRRQEAAANESSAAILQSVKVLAPAAPAAQPATGQLEKPMYDRLGGIVRMLHDSLRELGYDRSLSHAAAQIVDAQDRLGYVAQLTEQAANKVLNAVDLGIPEQDALAVLARQMEQQWSHPVDGAANDASMLADSRQFAARVMQASDAEKARLLEIMMAQDFQDITGQLIKKIVAIIRTVELELAQLLRDHAPPELRAAVAEQCKTEDLMQGPSMPAVALAQDGVDDLLDSLGF